jgi:hypothetical protein
MAELDYSVDLVVDRWFQVPGVGEQDPLAWASEIAQDVCEIDEQPEQRERLTEQLRLWAADPGRADHDVAAVLVPEAAAGVYAWLTITELAASADAPATVEWLELAGHQGPVVGGADVSRAELAAGPAVRVRAVVAAPREDGMGDLVEQVQWYVLPRLLAHDDPRQGTIVDLTVAWTGLAMGESDDLAELADDIAASLVVRPKA